jgi:hypothetical protein
MPIYRVLIRVFLYSLVALSVVIVFTIEAKYNGGKDFCNEDSWTEHFQVVLLFISTLFLIAAGRINREDHAMTTAMAGMTIIAMIRESDSILAFDLFDGAWQTGALVTALITFALVYKKKDEFLSSVTEFVKRPSFGYFVCGFITLFTYSRLFGRTDLWTDIMGNDHYIRAVKNGAEEGTELFGYSVLFIACVELLIEAFSRSKKPE